MPRHAIPDLPSASQFRLIRRYLGVTQPEYAVLLGIPGRWGWKQVSMFETGARPIRPVIMQTAQRLLEAALLATDHSQASRREEIE